jgi:hypothetical protein
MESGLLVSHSDCLNGSCRSPANTRDTTREQSGEESSRSRGDSGSRGRERGETKWSGIPLAMPTRGIRTAGSHGAAAAGDIWSLPCHRAWCRARAL